MESQVFFSTDGLTLTSANHIANLAKEYAKNAESELNNVSFVNKSLTIVGSDNTQTIHKGWTPEVFDEIDAKLNVIAQAHSLIAWLREAIKAHGTLMSLIEGEELSDYYETLPTKPVKAKEITKDEYIKLLTIKERNRIYALQARAAVFGTYIHPDGRFWKARKELMDKRSNPTEVCGQGRDTLLYMFEPTIPVENVDTQFYVLQQKHRAIQAELNGLLHKIDTSVEEYNAKVKREYNEALADYNAEIARLTSIMEAEREHKLVEARKLRIVIPNDLQEIYQTISALGK